MASHLEAIKAFCACITSTATNQTINEVNASRMLLSDAICSNSSNKTRTANQRKHAATQQQAHQASKRHLRKRHRDLCVRHRT